MHEFAVSFKNEIMTARTYTGKNALEVSEHEHGLSSDTK